MKTKVVGVVSAHVNSYAETFKKRCPVESPVNTIIADVMACRVPEKSALSLIWEGVERILKVSDDEIAEAMRILHMFTHNIFEGSGAAAYAAAMQES